MTTQELEKLQRYLYKTIVSFNLHKNGHDYELLMSKAITQALSSHDGKGGFAAYCGMILKRRCMDYLDSHLAYEKRLTEYSYIPKRSNDFSLEEKMDLKDLKVDEEFYLWANGMSKKDIAESLGIDRRTFYKRFNYKLEQYQSRMRV